MPQAKYSVNQHPISSVLAWIAQGANAIPEIQRPFVWSAKKDDISYIAIYREWAQRIKGSKGSNAKYKDL